MSKLYMITVPGIDVRLHWAPVHDRLLDDFPNVTDVLATTLAETLLIVYEGDADIDAWLAGVSDGVFGTSASRSRHTPATDTHAFERERTSKRAPAKSRASALIYHTSH